MVQQQQLTTTTYYVTTATDRAAVDATNTTIPTYSITTTATSITSTST